MLVKDKLIGALGQVCAGSTADADNIDLFALLANTIDQGDKITITSHQHKASDIRIGKESLHRIDTEIHIDAILDRTARPPHILIVIVGRHVDWFDRVGVERTGDTGITVPVGVGS